MSFDQVRLVRLGEKPGRIGINSDIFFLDIVGGRLCGRSAGNIVLARRHFDRYYQPRSIVKCGNGFYEEREKSPI